MSLLLLLIPALGGYWILSQAYITKHRILRESGYHLFLSVALVGIVVLCIARICVVIFDGFFPIHLARLWQGYAPFDYSGTVALSGIFAFAIPYLLSFFTNEKKEAMQAARVSGDFLECILQEAIEKRRLVEISMKNGKSYVGFVIESGVDVRVDCDVVMIPIVSGYRDQNTRELELTTNYANLLSNWDRPWDELAVVLPVTEIVSARHFDPKAYRQFDKDNGQFGD